MVIQNSWRFKMPTVQRKGYTTTVHTKKGKRTKFVNPTTAKKPAPQKNSMWAVLKMI
jgi:hypothetical protein